MGELALVIGALLFLGAAGCPSCLLARSQVREMSLNSIREQILSSLGLQQAPNTTGRPLPRIPPLEGVFERLQADQPFAKEEEDTEISPEKVYAFAQPLPKMRHLRGKEFLKFKFSEKVMENRVVKASLWLFTRTGQKENSAPLQITVFKVTSEEPPKLTRVNNITVRSWGTPGHWASIDVKPLVSEWFKTPSERMVLAVQASVDDQESSRGLFVTATHAGNSSHEPVLEVQVTAVKKKRIKRTVGLKCEENSSETLCCRYPLTVDFESFGWDWVIAPKKYEAYYCSGECPLMFLPSFSHTHLMSLSNQAGTSSGPCCAPRQLSSITMLYFTDDQNRNQNLSDNIVYGILPGMIVERCGCT